MDKQHSSLVENIYRQHKDHIYNYIHRMCNDPQLSQDIVQNTFIKLLSDPAIAGVEHQKAYLFTIARNMLFDEVKRKKPQYFEDSEQLEQAVEVISEAPLQTHAEEQAIANAVDKAIVNLPEKFRELMLLRYSEDLTINEIADITGRQLSDIKVNLHRARISFEQRFTATMYSKVAASRQRCDTLMELIAPFGNNDIPINDIPTIEKHIANCTNCNEDATEMKRRRELFALLPLLVAPALWEDIVKEAQASTLTPTAGTTTKTATAIDATAKLSTIKIATITAVTVGVIVGGIILSQQFQTETKQNLPDVPVAQSPAPTQLSSPTSPPTPSTPSSTTPSTASTPAAVAPQPIATTTQPQTTANSNSATTPAKPSEPADDPQPSQSSQQVAKLTPPKSVTPSTKAEEKVAAPQDDAKPVFFYNGPPFKAEEENVFNDEKETLTIYMSQHGVRAEPSNGFASGVVSITNFAKRKGWLVDQTRKVYLDTQLDAQGNSKILPVTNEHMDNLYDRKPCREFDLSKKLGTETIAGRSVEKWACGLTRTRDETLQWFDPEMKLIIAEENYNIGRNNVKNLTTQEIDASMYELPNDYKEVGLNEFFAIGQ